MLKNKLKNSILFLVQFFFSFKGTIDGTGFLLAVLVLSTLGDFAFNSENFLLKIISFGIIFYSSLAIIQKRNRDLGKKGNISIIITTLCFAFISIVHLLPSHITKTGLTAVMIIFMLLGIYYSFAPQNSKKNMVLTSYLLKNPNIYIIACFALFGLLNFLIKIYVSHYF